MEMTEQNNERAMIYDYRTGEEIRQATAEEEQRYIAQLLKLTGNQRTVGAVDGSEYDHDGSIYMQGGRVEIAAGIPDVDYDRAARLWSEYVGQQGTDEFMSLSEGMTITEAVEDYIDSMPEDWQEDAPEDLADMLTAYIERDVRMAQLLQAGDGIEDRRIRERDLQIEYGLSIRESEVVAAREDGLTNVEIARLMGITRQSVSNLLSKARAKGVRLDEGRDQGR